jgi:hypothetical protein
VTSAGHTGGLQQIHVQRIFPGILLRFGFLFVWLLENKVVLSFGDFGGQGCPHILVILYWLGGLVFPSGFLMITRLQN